MEEKVEKLLYELKSHIPVDETLKAELRNSFRKKRKPNWKSMWIYSAVAAIIIFSFFLGNFQPKPVKANPLKVMNSLSFVNIGSGEVTAMTHNNGKLYVSIQNKGIFIYSDEGLEPVSKDVVDSMSIDTKGENLLYSADGLVSVLNLKTKQKTFLIGDKSTNHYSHPVWKDSQNVFVTKETDSKNEIVEFNVLKRKETKVISGSSPSYKNETLVFERDGKIIIRNEKNGEEKVADTGIQPEISKDGQYVSYIKVENGVEDIWVIDLSLKKKLRATTNPVMNTEKGLYYYSFPEWSSNDRGLYVMKKQMASENTPMQIMKIDLGEKELDAKQTVSQFLQALIVRDDDYAKKMMKQPPEFLTISNPHQNGYQILKSEEKKDGTVHIKAEVTWSYTANPYVKVSNYDFTLVLEKNNYKITQVSEASSKELMMEVNKENVQLVEGKQKTTLFTLKDAPKQNVKSSNIRIATLALDQTGNNVFFTIQEMQDEQNQAAVDLFKYDINNKTFTFIDRVESLDGVKNIAIGEMSINGTGRYIALDVFLDEPPFSPSVLVYDVHKNKLLTQFKQTHSLFWQGDQLMMQRMVEDQVTILHRFDPTIKSK